VRQWSFSRERADFRQIVNELKAVDADVIFFSGLEPWAGDFLRAARAVGLKAPVVGAFSDTPEMRAHAGAGIEGAMFFDFFDPTATPAAVDFTRRFTVRFGKAPDAWAAQGYDALMILAKALKFTKSRNPLDLSYAIRYMDAWDGANGRYKFSHFGEIEDKPVYLKMYRGGVPVTVE
jgi:branched-chain amino acid transport system substrate-binding protein